MEIITAAASNVSHNVYLIYVFTLITLHYYFYFSQLKCLSTRLALLYVARLS